MTMYHAWVSPERLRSKLVVDRCPACGREQQATGKVSDDGLHEIACPHAARHVEDMERWRRSCPTYEPDAIEAGEELPGFGR